MTDPTNLVDLGRALRRVKDEHKKAKAEAAQLEKEKKRLEAQFREALEQSEFDFLPMDGRKLVPASTTYGQVQDRSAFVDWALENRPELVSYREEGERINDFVRECIDNGTPLPPGLGVRIREYVSDQA